MALSAKFVADFQSFYDAVKQAQASLDGLQKSAAPVAQSINQVAESFKSDGIIGQAKGAQGAIEGLGASFKQIVGGDVLGGLSSASTNVSALAGALGTAEVAAGVAVGAFAVAAGVFGELGVKAVEAGEAVKDFSLTTGIAVDHVVPLQSAIQIAGGNLETFGASLFRMQTRMAESPDTFERGLGRIGLSISQINDLKPDEQFLKIASAFRENTTESNRAATAFELFGRGGRDMIPLMMKPLQELNDELARTGHIMSGQDAQAAEELSISWRTLKDSISWTGTEVGVGVIHFFQDLYSGINQVFYLLEPTANGMKLLGDHISGDLPKAYGDFADKTKKATAAEDDFTEGIKATRDAFDHYWKPALIGAAATADELKDAENELKREHDEQVVAFKKMQQAVDDYNTSGQTYARLLTVIGDKTYEGIAADHARGVSSETLARIYGVTAGQISSVIRIEEQWKQSQEQAQKALDETVKSMGKFEEENDKAAKSVVTGPLTVLKDLSIQMDDVVIHGTQFSQNLGVIGDISGQADRHMRDLKDSVSKVGEALQGAESILGDFHNKITTVADDVLHTFDSIGKHLEDDDVFGAVVAGVVGGVHALVDAFKGIGEPSQQELQGRGAEAQFEKQFGSFQKMMDAVGAAYAATGKSAQQAQADVKALLDAEKQGGDAVTQIANKIQSAFTEQKKDAQDLTAAVQRYGFTLAELGPTMQKQQLDTQAQQLINDWRLLVGSGIQLSTVNERMASTVQDYLKNALLTGQEVPKSMQPILQSMIEQGKLVDANGVAITDMGQLGVTWSETMTEGFQSIVDKLEQLLDKIGMVPAAIAAIPTSIDVSANVNYNYQGGPDNNYAASGGLVMDHGIQYFGAGGRVLPFAPRGTDTVPAMLTPGELVLNKQQQARLLGAVNGTDAIDALRGDLKAQSQRNDSLLRALPSLIAAQVQSALAKAS